MLPAMIRKLCLLGFALFSMTVFAADRDTDRLIQEALKPSPLETNLHHLTDEVGGRVPGTPAMQRGVDWGVTVFRVAGADSVHTEEFTMPVSWAEGATEMVVASAKTHFRPRLVSIAWAPALAPVKHARIVDIGRGKPEDLARAGDVSGKILLVHSEILKTWADLFQEYMDPLPVIAFAVKNKATAIAFTATREHDILYRHTNSASGEIDRIPMVLLAREDAERVARLIAGGEQVYADLSIPNRIGGPIKTWNVVAEIRGDEEPDEFVVLGAHLDSWDLGTGALDNGCNSALVVDVLRAIKASGVKPRRTIRFILFSGEEEGLLGSRAYVVAHRAELDRAAGVVIFDAGTGRTTDFSTGGRTDVMPVLEPVLAVFAQFGGVKLAPTADAGTDNLDFLFEGVPTFVANQAEANYLENYHAISDTYDKVDFGQLKKHVAEAATLSFTLANLPQHVGPRLERAQIEQTMHESHLEDELRAMGMWEEWASGKRGRK
jgi:carboxypeptidase Q